MTTRRQWIETLLAATTAHVARTDPTYTRPSSVLSPSGGEMTPPSTGLAAGAGGAGAPVGGFPPKPPAGSPRKDAAMSTRAAEKKAHRAAAVWGAWAVTDLLITLTSGEAQR